jgi:hypothetical protein
MAVNEPAGFAATAGVAAMISAVSVESITLAFPRNLYAGSVAICEQVGNAAATIGGETAELLLPPHAASVSANAEEIAAPASRYARMGWP